MVAKISATANLGGALGYNFKKVAAGQAQVLLSSGLSLDAQGNTSLERTLEEMQLMLPSAMRTRKPVFHVSLNPHPDDRLTDEELTRIASCYMEQLGYGNQPYIVFKHNDIAREHIHIVSLRVDSEGRKINDSFEHRRSKRITRLIEQMWKLTPSDGEKIKRCSEDLQKADMADGTVKRKIMGTVAAVLDRYRFQSMGELNAVLARYNMVAEEVGKEKGGRIYKGIVYSVTDDKGRKQTVPVEAGELGRGFGYNALKSRMERFRKDFAPYRNSLRRSVRKAMSRNPQRDEFIRLMAEMKVSVLFRESDDGRIYGVTFIDDGNGVAANGSRLGRGYSAAMFHEYFNGSGDNPFLAPVHGLPARPETERRGDDLMAEVADTLFDLPAAQGTDYKELAFQKKMRLRYARNGDRRKL